MFGNNGRNSSPSNNNAHNSGLDYARLGDEAHAAGSLDEAIHLYLLAFDSLERNSSETDTTGVECLRKAWDDACELKDRSLAEHIFEKLEPYCTSDEVASHAEMLQRLALERLEEFGISPEDLQEMADMVTDDFLETSGFSVSPEMFVSHREGSKPIFPVLKRKESESKQSKSLDNKKEEKPSRGMPGGNGISFVYRDLVGYERAIQKMHERGIGLAEDNRFSDFIAMLSRRHGIDTLPAHHTLLFRAYSREDANRFMAATVGEMGLPTVRMFMEDSPQGLPILCVTASSDVKPYGHFQSSPFDGPGVLVLEDIDLWGPPLADAIDDFEPHPYPQLSRGAREAIMFIRSCVESSDVTVLASCVSDVQLEDFFLDMLDPILPIDIDVPDDSERAEIWKHAATMYPSLRFIDRGDLVRLSRNMSREDIYLAARESVEQAYRQSVEKRSFVPVTRDNIFDKVAAYQPLESEEYKELEDAAVRSWRVTLDNLEDLINKKED